MCNRLQCTYHKHILTHTHIHTHTVRRMQVLCATDFSDISSLQELITSYGSENAIKALSGVYYTHTFMYVYLRYCVIYTHVVPARAHHVIWKSKRFLVCAYQIHMHAYTNNPACAYAARVTARVFKVIERQFQRFSSSKLVLKTVVSNSY